MIIGRTVGYKRLKNPVAAYRARRVSELGQLIAQLYGNGEQGAMYIPQPHVLGQQVLFQDAAGTVPAVDDGDPVGLMLDLSGNDNHASQSVSGARPIYPGLSYDGASDFVQTSAVIGKSDFALCFVLDAARLTDNSVLAANYDGSNSGFILYGSTSLGSAAGNVRLWTNRDQELLIGPDFRGAGNKIVTVSRLGGLYSLRINGAVYAEAVGSIESVARPITYIGRRGGSQPDFLSADVGGTILFESATVEKVFAAEQCLATLAGVTLEGE